MTTTTTTAAALPPLPPLGARCGWWVHRTLAALATPLSGPVAPGAHPPPARTAAVPRQRPRPAGSGLPVLLVGGLGSTAASLAPLAAALAVRGCVPVTAPVGYGLDCGERTTARVEAALGELAAVAGRACAVVGHSRGGHFARSVAVRRPELVAGLVTVGSPVNRMLGVHPLVRAEAYLLGAAGSLGVPGLMRLTCRYGACCRRLRADLQAPVPAGVPFVSVFSRSDRVVDWRSCLDPGARHVEVAASHTGLVSAPAALAAVADALAGLAVPDVAPVVRLAA